MRSVACWLFVVSLCQGATRNVTVLMNFEKPHSVVSVVALRDELRELLKPAGIAIDVMLKSELPASPQFAELVVFEMKGWCSMEAEEPVMIDERGPLGLAYSSDGEVLHFGEVRCDRIRQCLERITRGAHPEKHQVEYSTAVGMVVAHEIYHMMAGSKTHTKNGLTKESLSAFELLDGTLTIPAGVRAALRRDLWASGH
jgi:hypothetical protein